MSTEKSDLFNFMMECRARKESLREQALQYLVLEELTHSMIESLNASDKIMEHEFMRDSVFDFWEMVVNKVPLTKKRR